jgi:hypothetical protein
MTSHAPAPVSVAVVPAQAGFCAQTEHHPPAGTVWPTKMLQPATASPGLPWNCAQLPHFCVGLKVG